MLAARWARRVASGQVHRGEAQRSDEAASTVHGSVRRAVARPLNASSIGGRGRVVGPPRSPSPQSPPAGFPRVVSPDARQRPPARELAGVRSVPPKCRPEPQSGAADAIPFPPVLAHRHSCATAPATPATSASMTPDGPGASIPATSNAVRPEASANAPDRRDVATPCRPAPASMMQVTADREPANPTPGTPGAAQPRHERRELSSRRTSSPRPRSSSRSRRPYGSLHTETGSSRSLSPGAPAVPPECHRSPSRPYERPCAGGSLGLGKSTSAGSLRHSSAAVVPRSFGRGSAVGAAPPPKVRAALGAAADGLQMRGYMAGA